MSQLRLANTPVGVDLNLLWAVAHLRTPTCKGPYAQALLTNKTGLITNPLARAYFIPKKRRRNLWGAGEIWVNLAASCFPKPRLTMKGQDTQEPQLGCMVGQLQGPPSQQGLAPSAGHFLGPLIFPQELAKAVFSSRFILSWFIYLCICFPFSLA